jgi:hypothetical protein
MCTMKPSILVAIMLAVVIGCGGCQGSRVTALEKRVSELELKVKYLEAAQAKSADARSQQEEEFRSCVVEANDDYHSAIRGNGTKNGAASYSVSLPVLQEIERQKQAKLEECKLLYR